MSASPVPGRWVLDRIAGELQARPPLDLPPDYAVIRSVGAMRIWDDSAWRGDGHEWQAAERHVLAPESAAERLAAPGEGSGHPRPAERRSGPLAGDR